MIRGHARVWFALSLCAVVSARVLAGPPDPPTGAGGKPPHDLLSIAKREAERQRAKALASAQTLLNDLRSSPDESQGYVQSKITDLAGLGPPVLELIAAAMDHEDAGQGAQNEGINAARAGAKIGGPEARACFEKLATSTKKFGRRNAALALGRMNDPSAAVILKPLVSDPEAIVVQEALRALGALGVDGTAELLASYVAVDNGGTATAAIQGLTRMGHAPSADAVLARLVAEQSLATPGEEVQLAALAHLGRFPPSNAAAAVPALERPLEAGNASPALRSAAIAALSALAQHHDEVKKPVIAALKLGLGSASRNVVTDAAKALVALGDDSGVQSVTADLDDELNRSPKNYNARYKRAALLLDFGKFKEALRDYREALKVDKEPADPNTVYVSMARCYAGVEQFSEAQRALQKLGWNDYSPLPKQYLELKRMADDSRFRAFFQPPK